MKKIESREDMMSTFGMSEYEGIAYGIVKYYQNNPSKTVQDWFDIKDVTDDPEMFAMFCASGWINANYFPKRTFFVSNAFKQRLIDRKLKI